MRHISMRSLRRYWGKSVDRCSDCGDGRWRCGTCGEMGRCGVSVVRLDSMCMDEVPRLVPCFPDVLGQVVVARGLELAVAALEPEESHMDLEHVDVRVGPPCVHLPAHRAGKALAPFCARGRRRCLRCGLGDVG